MSDVQKIPTHAKSIAIEFRVEEPHICIPELIVCDVWRAEKPCVCKIHRMCVYVYSATVTAPYMGKKSRYHFPRISSWLKDHDTKACPSNWYLVRMCIPQQRPTYRNRVCNPCQCVFLSVLALFHIWVTPWHKVSFLSLFVFSFLRLRLY